MKRNWKVRFYYFIEKSVSAEILKSILLVGLVVVYYTQKGRFCFLELIDVGILVPFFILVFSGLVVSLLKLILRKKLEDHVKILDDAKKLVETYPCEEFIEYHKGNILVPGIVLWEKKGSETNIEIVDDPDKYYKLPEQVAENSAEIMKVHKASQSYNQINIRIDDIKVDDDNKLIIHSSRTCYLDSLITNRACDCLLNSNKTIRETYDPGPYMISLSHSKMSNHLGMNGLIITSDGWIPMIMRRNDVTIGKDTLSTSISASIKTKYAVSGDKHEFTPSGLFHAIKNEIHDELGIPTEYIKEEDIKNSILLFYRDVSECGKPQIIFCLRMNNLKKDEMESFIKSYFSKKEGEKKHNPVREAKEAFMIRENDFKDGKLEIAPLDNKIVLRDEDNKEKKYKINMASTIAMAYEINYLNR